MERQQVDVAQAYLRQELSGCFRVGDSFVELDYGYRDHSVSKELPDPGVI
jgi:hypothetical protein